jgi:hypothetical protein
VCFDDGQTRIRNVDPAQALKLAKPRIIHGDQYYQLDLLSCSARAPAAPAHVQSRKVDERARSSERACLTAQDAPFAASQRRSTWPPCSPADRAHLDAHWLRAGRRDRGILAQLLGLAQPRNVRMTIKAYLLCTCAREKCARAERIERRAGGPGRGILAELHGLAPPRRILNSHQSRLGLPPRDSYARASRAR